MQITSVQLVSNNRAVAEFSFRDPRARNPYVAKLITGLDAEDVVSKFYGFSNSDGTPFNNLTPKRGPIAFDVHLNPEFTENSTYSSLRDELYKAIASTRSGAVKVCFKYKELVVAEISGRITKLEAEHFSGTPRAIVTVQPDKFSTLRSPDLYKEDVSSMGAHSTVVDSISTAPHGLDIAVTCTNDLGFFALYDLSEDGTTYNWTFIVDFDFLAGDVLHINSATNKKSIYVDRGGVITPVADRIRTGSQWPVIFPKENQFLTNTINYFEWTSLSYYPTYWGI